MKPRSGVFAFLLIFLTSCTFVNHLSFDGMEIGAWGPIDNNISNPEGQIFLSQAGSPEEKIKVDLIKQNNKYQAYPVEPLIAGEIYQLVLEGKSKPVVDNIHIRKSCIVYLVQSEEGLTLWKKCPDANPFQITKPDEAIEDFSVSRSGELIFYTKSNDQGGNEIWQMKPDGSNRKIVFNCGETDCSDLELDSFTRKLVFRQQSLTPQIGLLDLQTGNLSYLDGYGSEFSLSPDGRFLSLLDDESGKLTIINIVNKNQIIVQSGNGLAGEWARDSLSILFGEMEFWGGIPGVKVNEMEIPSGEIKPILFDPNQELEFYQPRYTKDEGVYLASVRLRSTGASRQLWLLGVGAEGIKQITTDPLFHYSLPSWSPDYSELVFQRFPLNKSDGQPQIVVWNQNSDSFRVIAENASRPVWLP